MALKRIKKAIASALAVAMVAATLVMPVSAAETDFTDVEDNQWYTSSVERWSDSEIITGYKNASGELTGLFGPADEIQRGQMATIIARLLGLKATTVTPFTDADANAYYYDAVMACAEAGIITGYKDEAGNLLYLFGPEDPITREQAFTMIYRALKLVAGETEATLGEFSDGASVSDWAAEATAAMINYKGVSGKEDTPGVFTIAPQENVSRAQVTTMLDRLIAVYVTKNGEVSKTTAIAESEDESKIGSVVVVNSELKDFVEVSFSRTEENDIVITVTKYDENGEEVGTTNILVPAKSAVTQAPIVVENGKGKELEEDVIVPINPIDPIDPDHECVFETVDECTNCAVAHTPYSVCECGAKEELEEVAAHTHTFADGTCECCGMTVDQAMKFYAKVASNDNYVEAVVTNDYAAELTITPGKVLASDVDVTVKMQNVGSLGVDGVREETKHFDTGLSGDPELALWLSNAFTFTEGYVDATIDGNPVFYTLNGSVVDNNAVITAEPADVEATRTAWQAMTSHVTATTQEVSDSYIEIANGSYMVIGNDKLSFEKGVEGNLKLDGFSTEDGLSGLESQIRSMVQLNQTNDAEGTAEFYLAAGTKLAVSNSIATLEDNCTIKVTGLDAESEKLQNILPDLQAAEGGYAMAQNMVQLINEMIASTNGSTIYVDMTFEEPVVKETKFYAGITANNADGNGTTTVDMEVFDDYSLEVNLPMNEISASEVTLNVEMNNVASMGVEGTKSHTQTISTGMTATGDLAFWMSNAATFEAATVNVDVNGAECTYALESDMDADWVTITGTTDTEAARAAWQTFAANLESGSKDVDDSYFLIAPNSTLEIGKDKLVFEDGADAMNLNNFSDLTALKQEVKDSVKLVPGEGALKLVVGKDTTLAVSNSYAKVKADTTIVVEVKDANGNAVAIPQDVLAGIQAAADDNNALVKELFNLLNELVGTVNNAVVDVTVTF